MDEKSLAVGYEIRRVLDTRQERAKPRNLQVGVLHYGSHRSKKIFYLMIITTGIDIHHNPYVQIFLPSSVLLKFIVV